jgi:hypothetical protein
MHQPLRALTRFPGIIQNVGDGCRGNPGLSSNIADRHALQFGILQAPNVDLLNIIRIRRPEFTARGV